MAPKAAIPTILFLAVTLGGCADVTNSAIPATPTELADAALASYQDHPIRLIEVIVTSKVRDNFSTDYLSQSYASPFFVVNQSVQVTLETELARFLWLVEDNDTVIVGRYNLTSNKHSIIDTQVSIAADQRSAQILLGGMNFVLAPLDDARALAYFGGVGNGGYHLPLPTAGGKPIAVRGELNHTSTFPMSTNIYDTVFEERMVDTEVEFRYYPNARFRISPTTIESMLDEPDSLHEIATRTEADFALGGRLGQWSSRCAWIVKGEAPCLNPWEHALT